jgi:Glycosyl transferase family 2
MADWGVCSTIQAPVDQVLAFVAHHQGLGASQMWLFFDDPDDPAFGVVQRLAGVTATCCDVAYWQSVCKTRPDTHQNRQSRNMRRVYNLAALPWVAHLDVDEFLWPSRPIADVLDEVPQDQILLRMAPWEALHAPGLRDDIFTAHQFRAALKGDQMAEARKRTFGPYAAVLGDGVLSHSAGKCFFQRGFAGLQPRLHGAFLGGERVKGVVFHPDIALLHFHAEDPDRWKQRLPFRLTKGAYQFNPKLQAHLLAASPAEVDAFYDVVQHPSAEVLAYLAGSGLLINAALDLRGKVSALTGGTIR